MANSQCDAIRTRRAVLHVPAVMVRFARCEKILILAIHLLVTLAKLLLCSAITRSHRRRRPKMFVIRATLHRSDANPEGLADSTAGEWCRGGRNEAGLVRQLTEGRFEPARSRLGDGPATGSVRPGSNICGAPGAPEGRTSRE